MSPSKALFYICISFVAGIFLEFVIRVPQIFLWGIFILGSVLIFISLFKPKISIIAGFCILFFVLGILRVQIAEFNIKNDKLSKLNGKSEITFTGVVAGEPDVRDTSQKLEVKVVLPQQAGDSKVLVTTDRYPEYEYLDKLKITGKLEAPTETPEFNYKNYLIKDGIYSVMGFPKIELVSKKHQYNIFSFSYEKILFVKQKLIEALQNNFLPPHSLILEGIILGNNKNMTQDLREKLNASGLRFLTAISGVHVIILSVILASFMLLLGLRRNYAFCFSIIFIWLYIVITGFSSSGIRAATMGSIFIFAEIFGRQNTSSRTIVLAASLMLLQNPLLLIYDIGFQLSFMASLGIIYLKPAISNLFKSLFRDRLKEFSDILSITITAQVFTLPVMIFNFGSVSLVATITNILIMPVMPLILSFGFLFSIFASVSKILGYLFYLPTYVLTAYFLNIMDIFSQPWMAKSITNVSWVWLLVAYIIIFSATWFLNKKYSQKIV